MLWLVGIGLSMQDLSIKVINALKKVEEIYIEIYTTPMPFKIKEYEKFLEKIVEREVKLKKATRNLLEEKSKEFVNKAKNKDIALLVYGDPLIATTHLALIKEAKQMKIKTKIIHNASIINAITNTGLSIYKFGKIASMPKWQENYKPKSFYEIIKQNKSINAHTLLLVDFELDFENALKQLKEVDKENIIKEIFICSMLGTNKEFIIKKNLKKIKSSRDLKRKIKKPFCFVIPSELSFYEK